MFKSHLFSNSIRVVNTTPHEITFQDGTEVVSVPNCGILINAKTVETVIISGIPTFVKTEFVGDSSGEDAITAIHQEFSDCVIIGSIITAQAYPGKIVAMTPMPGFERVPPNEKRMNPAKFTIF